MCNDYLNEKTNKPWLHAADECNSRCFVGRKFATAPRTDFLTSTGTAPLNWSRQPAVYTSFCIRLLSTNEAGHVISPDWCNSTACHIVL